MFNKANTTKSFNSKVKRTGKTGKNGRKDVEKMVLVKYPGNFLRILEMILINYEINLILTWSVDYALVSAGNTNQSANFWITDKNLYVLATRLSTKEKAKLLQQLKSVFKRTINWKNFNQK